MENDTVVAEKIASIVPHLNERQRRLFLAAEARSLGYGGITRVSAASGVSVPTIRRGMRELRTPPLAHGRARTPGGGRHRATDNDPALAIALDRLVEPSARGAPESPLRWTILSTRTLADTLTAQGHPASHAVVARLLDAADYSLQANRKTREGRQSPDRNAQFEHIAATMETRLAAGEPVISVDAKKTELVGDFKNAGQTWRPQGEPEAVRVYDFPISGQGRATPDGVYDLARNTGWVSVGIDHDTASFAVNTIRHWWTDEGQVAYPTATTLMITADGGGSNGSRVRLWKWELQQMANETGLHITVCHFPPGTSKWNKIEHRLFWAISNNWRGQPLTSVAVMVDWITRTRTRTGLTVTCREDKRLYPVRQSVSKAEFASIHLDRDTKLSHWNYTIHPNNK